MSARSQGDGKPDGPEARVFVSYSRADVAFVDRLASALETHGIASLIDRSDIHAFEAWWARIESLIAAADTIVFVLSPDSISSPICRREVDYAVTLNKRFAPIVCKPIGDVMDAVPPALADLNFVFFDPPERFDTAMKELVAALSTDIGWVREHTALGLQAAEWAKGSRARGLLLRSPRLEAAERWVAARPSNVPDPTPDIVAFLRESRASATYRRNLLTAALAVGFVCAIGLAGVAFWQRSLAVDAKLEAIRQRNVAEASERRANDEKRRAERSASAAESAARSLVFDFAQGIRDRTGMPQDLVELILGRADKVLKDLSDTLPDDRTFLRLRADGLLEIGETLEKKGSLDQAKTVYRESESILEGLATADAGDDLTNDLAIAHSRLGLLLLQTGDTTGAGASLEAARAIRMRLLGRTPNDSARKLAVALDVANLGAVKAKANDIPGALSLYEDAHTAIKLLAGAEPHNLKVVDALGMVARDLGNTRWANHDSAGALVAYREYNASFATLVAANKTDMRLMLNLGLSHSAIGEMLEARADLPNALEAYRSAQTIIEQIAAENPNITPIRLQLAQLQSEIGGLLRKQHEDEKSALAFTAARSILEEVQSKEPDNKEALRALVVAYVDVGLAEEALLARDEALIAYQAAQRTISDLAAREPSNVEWTEKLAASHDLIGEVKQDKKDYPGALEAFRAGFAIRDRLSQRDPRNDLYRRSLLLARIRLAHALLQSGLVGEAKEQAAIALDVAARAERANSTGDAREDLERAVAVSRQADIGRSGTSPKTQPAR